MLSRREALQLGLGSLGSLCFSPSLSAENEEPHYFITFFTPGGMDPNITFDARPLEMTALNMQHQAHDMDPIPYVGQNGESCLRTSLTDPWLPFLQDFSIINGMHMSPFDGHEQNVATLFTTNSFGGDSFIPQLHGTQTLDFIRIGEGNFLVEISNASNAIQLETKQAVNLGKKLLDLDEEGKSSLKSSIKIAKKAADGTSPFSLSSGLLATSLRQLPRTARVFTQLAQNDYEDDYEASVQLVGSIFKEKLTQCAIIVFDTDLNRDLELDVHDPDSARQLPKTIETITAAITKMLHQLQTIPATRTKSVYDCSTILIASEFGRTMRQYSGDVTKDGTDHNPFRNTLLIGGKRIRGGLVIGSTDLPSSAAFLSSSVSPAHLSLDPKLFKVFGRPFDYREQKTSSALPTTHQLDDYLNMAALTNTILKAFDRPESLFRSTERGKPTAPLLKALLR